MAAWHPMWRNKYGAVVVGALGTDPRQVNLPIKHLSFAFFLFYHLSSTEHFFISAYRHYTC